TETVLVPRCGLGLLARPRDVSPPPGGLKVGSLLARDGKERAYSHARARGYERLPCGAAWASERGVLAAVLGVPRTLGYPLLGWLVGAEAAGALRPRRDEPDRRWRARRRRPPFASAGNRCRGARGNRRRQHRLPDRPARVAPPARASRPLADAETGGDRAR